MSETDAPTIEFGVGKVREPHECMRWLADSGRCEIWTGERWIDLERDLMKPLAEFHDEMRRRR